MFISVITTNYVLFYMIQGFKSVNWLIMLKVSDDKENPSVISNILIVSGNKDLKYALNAHKIQ